MGLDVDRHAAAPVKRREQSGMRVGIGRTGEMNMAGRSQSLGKFRALE